jgi:putative ABC transport system permease protein
MRVLAVIVAFFGIAGALMTFFVERQKEFGVYRALVSRQATWRE